MKVMFIVRRDSSDEFTYAKVEAEVDRVELAEASAFLSALRAGVSDWTNYHATGRAAWQASSQDLNIGDLSGHTKDARLRAALREEGITNLKITCTCYDQAPASCWSYDSVLAEEPDDEEK
jgi:hypothetical protein